jgi:hypothetical protein
VVVMAEGGSADVTRLGETHRAKGVRRHDASEGNRTKG